MLYMGTQCVSHSIHCPPRLYMTNLLILYEAKVAVCSEIRTKHRMLCEHSVGILDVKPGDT
jgi:hypothetical protein